MNTLVVDVFNASIFLGGLLALWRITQLDRRFYPFIFILWIGGLNEMASYWLAKNGHHTLLNNNLYVLAESLFLTCFFQRVLVLPSHKETFRALLLSLVLFWITENLLCNRLFSYSNYFRIYYSALLVGMSLLTFNQLLLSEKPLGEATALFMLCTGFIMYFLPKVLVNSFWIYGLSGSRPFQLQVSRIMVTVNFITNLIYAIAILWIPRKKPSLLPLP